MNDANGTAAGGAATGSDTSGGGASGGGTAGGSTALAALNREHGAAHGYSPRRTLPISVEIVRQFRRRRTLVMFGLLLALPWVLVIAFKVGGGWGRPGGSLRISDLAAEGGLNFSAFALSVSASFLLVVAVALFCGDTVASEADWSSLRYLLAAPIPRDRLLRQKLIVALGYSAAAVICLPLMALLAGTLAFGWNDVRVPGTGEVIPALDVLPRFGIVIGYALVSQLVVAATAFLLSVGTDSPLGAVGGAVGLVIVSTILQAVEALGALREFLPTFWNTAWLDALAPQPDFGGMVKGVAVSVTYAAILIAFAFRRFRTKDVVS
ncbi:ABC transporter permease [Planobispora rosea]|uniref:ABC transporter permease n=1 Tax=Planobispora rosea TaxID=35762 RepID=B5LT07_PLARO|nr:ABC transporter permease [Planobispora rosea]ACG70954.1 putative ABC transporter permease protein [Planobispora rosea]GGS51167.1 ABC transporter permease [Planobispora rosea]GIH82878.1 ABC transporter permease [Planobispora rosea]